MAAQGHGLGGQGVAHLGPLAAGQGEVGAELAQLHYAEFVPQAAHGLPGGVAGQTGVGQGLPKPGEGPGPSHGGGVVQGGLDPGPAGQVNGHQVQEGTQGVAEAAPALGRLATDQHVGEEEAAKPQPHRGPGGQDHGDVDPGQAQHRHHRRQQGHAQRGKQDLVNKEALGRAAQDGQVPVGGGQPQARAVEGGGEPGAECLRGSHAMAGPGGAIGRRPEALQGDSQGGSRRPQAPGHQHQAEAEAGTGEEGGHEPTSVGGCHPVRKRSGGSMRLILVSHQNPAAKVAPTRASTSWPSTSL